MLELTESVLEACVLLAFSWPVWRLLVFGPVRDRVTTKTVGLAGLFVFYAASVMAVAVYSQTLLRAMTVLALLAVLGLIWWTRPGFRHGRRTPPGRLTVLPLAPCLDHRFYQRQAARYGSIFKTGSSIPCPSLRPTVNVVGHKLGLDLLRDHDHALLLWPPAPFSLFIPRGHLRYMNPDDHKVHSQLFRSAMTPTLIGDCADFARLAARTAFSRMAADSASRQSCSIRPLPYINRMLFAVLARTLFGITSETQSFNQLQGLYRDINIPKLTLRSRRKRVQRSFDNMIAFLVVEGNQLLRRTRSESYVSPCVLSEILRVEPERVDDSTMLGNLVYMLHSGRTDIGGLLIWTLKHLVDYPEWLKELRVQPQATVNSLADRVVSETLRLERSEYLHRRVLHDIDVGAYVIPKGWLLRVCIRDGHRDKTVFENPDLFDPDRFLNRKYSHTEYAPFGLFRHVCSGSQLTRAVGRAFVAELAIGFDCQLVDDGRRVHGRFHWQPSERFQLRFTHAA